MAEERQGRGMLCVNRPFEAVRMPAQWTLQTSRIMTEFRRSSSPVPEKLRRHDLRPRTKGFFFFLVSRSLLPVVSGDTSKTEIIWIKCLLFPPFLHSFCLFIWSFYQSSSTRELMNKKQAWRAMSSVHHAVSIGNKLRTFQEEFAAFVWGVVLDHPEDGKRKFLWNCGN